MSLSDITLPGNIIADLYKKSLVQTGFTETAPKPSVAQKPENPFPPVSTAVTSNNYKILGNNQQQVTIVVDFEEEIFLPDKHLQFLTKMLEACKLNLGDVAIVNHAKKPVDMELIREQLNPTYVLLFGVEPVTAKLPMNFPAFKEQAYAGSTYLHTPGLGMLNVDNEEGKLLKSKLWVCLRKLFKV